jgi:hypothetical protein
MSVFDSSLLVWECCEISDVAIGAIKQVGGSTTARCGVLHMKTLVAKDHR